MNSSLSPFQIYPLIHPKNSWLEEFAVTNTYTLGYCPICGQLTIFLKFNENLRESGRCKVCHSTNRNRQMAVLLLGVIKEAKGLKFKSIKELIKQANILEQLADFKIYNTETTGCLHNLLKELPNYTASEYLGTEYISGEVINGILHQDLTNTTFADYSFDVVLSSDVFEHIPNPYEGFQEIYRILKFGGRHIFTVPFYSDRYRDEVRSKLQEDGSINHIMPPIYHGDPIRTEGILVYVIFSLEMLVKLSDFGYNSRMYNVNNYWQGILGHNAIVFDTIKTKTEGATI
jgi:SAM-dependent methyltransferase